MPRGSPPLKELTSASFLLLINMSDQPLNKTDELIEEFIEEMEREAAKLEVTVDYYLAEFVV